MRKFIFPFAAALGLMLAGCSNGEDGGGGGGNIRLGEGTQTEQQVYADEVRSEGAASFTTNGAWTSSISEVGGTRAATPDWISISPDRGSAAGDYTINIIMDTNYSGSDRTAEITINCGAAKITITVTQKGTQSDGKVPERPRLITGITESANINSDYYSTYGPYEPYSYEFVYDLKYRLREYTVKEYNGSQYIKYTYNYDYLDQVRITTDNGDWYRADLNGAGYAAKIYNPESYYYEGRYDGECHLNYDNDGNIVRMSDSLDMGDWTKFTWNGGNIVKLSTVWEPRPDDNDDTGGDDDEDAPGGFDPGARTRTGGSVEGNYRYPVYSAQLNKTNLDLNMFFFGLKNETDWLYGSPRVISYGYFYDFFAFAGLTGNRSKNLIVGWDWDNSPEEANLSRRYNDLYDEEPAHGVYSTSYRRELDGHGVYVLDANGYPTSYSQKVKMTKVVYTYNGQKQYISDHEYIIELDASTPVVAYDTYTYNISYDK